MSEAPNVHLTEDEALLILTAFTAWQQEYAVTGDDWSEEDALSEKLMPIAYPEGP